MPAALRLVDGGATRHDLFTRMPFRYGIATVTALPHVFVRVALETVDGRVHEGVAADHLAPKWFTKNPDTAPEQDIAEMARVVEHALTLARGLTGDSPWALWRRLYEAQAAWGRAEGMALLLSHFGVTLVERALLDAFCRAHGRPFHELLRAGALGIRLAEVRPELGDAAPADLLPPAPLASVRVRHTVGLSDPLTDADVPDDARLSDGLPQTLEASIRAYGLRHFKLKAGGDPAADAARLGEIVSVLAATVPNGDEWAFSVDGNESYKSVDDLRALWEAARSSPALAPHLTAGRLLFVEQPLHRAIALSDAAGDALAAWPDAPPLVIDESDADLSSLPRALSLGYAGTSHKNCKGVFKGIANACLLAHRRLTTPGLPALLSGEDLSNVGPVALNQDLAVQAALGIESVERNGQHYFRGLAAFPPDLQADALAAHPDLYRRVGDGNEAGSFVALAITDGRLRLGSVNAAPFGVGHAFAPARFAPLEVSEEEPEPELHQAARRGDAAEVRRLLDAGADLDALYWGDTALGVAAMRGDQNVADLLLTAGANPNLCDHYSPLMLAVMDGHEAVAKRLLEASADPELEEPEFRCTPLMSAVEKGRTNLVALLALHGADPLRTDWFDVSALEMAHKRGDEVMVGILLRAIRHESRTVPYTFSLPDDLTEHLNSLESKEREAMHLHLIACLAEWLNDRGGVTETSDRRRSYRAVIEIAKERSGH